MIGRNGEGGAKGRGKVAEPRGIDEFFGHEKVEPEESYATGLLEQQNAVLRRELRGSRKSRDMYRLMLECVEEPIVIADGSSGVIIAATVRAEKLFGMPLSRLVGRHQSEIHPAVELARYRTMFQAALRSARPVEERMSIVRADAVLVPVAVHASAVLWDGRQVVRQRFSDLSERKELEARIHQLEVFQKKMLAGATDMVFLLDGHGLITTVGAVALRVLRRGEREVLGSDFLSYVHPSDRRGMEEELAALRRTGELLRHDRTVRLADRHGGFHSASLHGFSLERGTDSGALCLALRRRADESPQAPGSRQRAAGKQRLDSLGGILTICASCKKIRTEAGGWSSPEEYLRSRTGTEFSHGICPGCARSLYPDVKLD